MKKTINKTEYNSADYVASRCNSELPDKYFNSPYVGLFRTKKGDYFLEKGINVSGYYNKDNVRVLTPKEAQKWLEENECKTAKKLFSKYRRSLQKKLEVNPKRG